MIITRITSGPHYEGVRQRFYEGRRRGTFACSKVPFERYVELLEEARQSFAELARETGIPEQRLRRIDRLYVRHLYGGKHYYERYLSHVRENARVRIEECLSNEWYEWVKHFHQEARRAGHVVEPIVANDRVLHRSIRISGKLCLGFPITSVRLLRKHRWARLNIRQVEMPDVCAAIFPVLIDGTTLHTMVVPAEELRERLSRQRRPILNIPLDSPLEGTCRRKGFEPNDYNGRWDLIPKTSARW